MKRLAVALAFAFLALAPSSQAQVAPADLAQPPAGAETWNIISTAGQHGTSRRWTTPDGVRWSRDSILLRGFVTEIDQRQRLGADGFLTNINVRGVTPSGDASESFNISNGRFEFRSPVDSGADAMPAGAFYSSFGGTLNSSIAFIDALRGTSTRSMRLLPSGEARLEQLTTVQVSSGGQTKNLTAYAIVGVGLSPFAVWYEGDRFFAFAGFLSYVPPGWESVVEQLSAAQDAALATRSRALVDQLASRQTQPVVFQNVRIFDSQARRFRDNQTVVVTDGRITAVGRSARVPAGARVIPGAGRTLVPGLWDSHMHYGNDDTGPLLLAQGITSARDPGNRINAVIERRRRIEAGELLGPRIVPSVLVDGAGPNSAQMAVLANTPEEAVAAVRRAHDMGFFGIKMYGSLDASLVPVIAAEAHRLGMRVHGHVPRGMRPLEAIRAGYDELTHINFVMMQAMPEEVVQNSNGIARHMGTAQFAPDVDLNAPDMRAFLDELEQRGVAVDPTLVTFELEYTPESGQVSAAYAPFIGTMPPQVERSFRAGGLPPTPEVSRERMRQAQTALSRLVGELHRRGVTIVAGTDGSGLELVRELELYVAAGFTPADALASATIVPSREFGVGDETGAIAVGRRAELFLVEGDPSRNIGDLRNVLFVMRDGRLMEASALRTAIGISGPPHPVR